MANEKKLNHRSCLPINQFIFFLKTVLEISFIENVSNVKKIGASFSINQFFSISKTSFNYEIIKTKHILIWRNHSF